MAGHTRDVARIVGRDGRRFARAPSKGGGYAVFTVNPE